MIVDDDFRREIWDSPRFWRSIAAALATTVLALVVAAEVARAPPDFAERHVIAVLRDGGQHAVWLVRLAQTAHQIAVDGLGPPAPPPGKVYQLWLRAIDAAAPQPLGLLPLSGRKVIAESPANIRRLAGTGELLVTLEPAEGALPGAPSGPPMFRASLGARH